jgi:hypothetical protein
MIAVNGKVITVAAATLYAGAGLGYTKVGTQPAGAVGTALASDASWKDGVFWKVDFGAVTGWVQASLLQEQIVAPPPPPPPPVVTPPPPVVTPPPVPTTGLIPAFGASMISDHYNTGPADWIDLATLPPPVPFSGWFDAAQKIIAPSQNGVRPSKLRRIPLYGPSTGLYSCVPMIFNGRHRQWNPEVYSGRDFSSITPRVTKDPAPVGVRGVCIVDPYGIPRAHPQPTVPINPRAPLFVTLEPSGRLIFELPEKLVSAGIIPGLKDPHDLALDESDLDRIVIANTGMNSVVAVNRRPAIDARPAGGVEDATKYVVTPLATGLVKPTSVEVMKDGTVYACDETAGVIYRVAAGVKVPVVSGLTRPFCIRRTSRGTLLIATVHLHVYELDPVTGLVGLNLMPTNYLRTVPAVQKEWTWLGVDENGVLGPKDEFWLCDSSAQNNVAVWHFRADGRVLFNAQIMGQSSTTVVGDNSHGVEWSHYFWTVVPHTSQAILRSTGFANCYPTYLRPPIPSDAPEEPHDHALYRRGEEVVKYGSGRTDGPDSYPSLTALMTPTGWSLLGITSDYMVQQAKLNGWAWLDAYIKGGMGGTTPRPGITGYSLLGLVYFIVKTSQQYLSEGATLWNAARSYFVGKYPGCNINDDAQYGYQFTARKMGDATRFLRASYAAGVVTVNVEDKWGNRKTTPPPGPVDVIVDEKRPSEKRFTITAAPWTVSVTLTPGLHSITCRTAVPNYFAYGVVVAA